jgi:hypothetical protein
MVVENTPDERAGGTKDASADDLRFPRKTASWETTSPERTSDQHRSGATLSEEQQLSVIISD